MTELSLVSMVRYTYVNFLTCLGGILNLTRELIIKASPSLTRLMVEVQLALYEGKYSLNTNFQFNSGS